MFGAAGLTGSDEQKIGDVAGIPYDKLKLSMSKDQLKQARNFQPYQPPRATTGDGGPVGQSGLGMRPRPSSNTPASGSQ